MKLGRSVWGQEGFGLGKGAPLGTYGKKLTTVNAKARVTNEENHSVPHAKKW